MLYLCYRDYYTYTIANTIPILYLYYKDYYSYTLGNTIAILLANTIAIL